MFSKILIANRGEIALRIVRACHEMGIRTIVAYSEADADTLAVAYSDEAICIGRAPASESYLCINRLIATAEITNADAIHPGYGFLAENAHFAEVCESCNIKFIGPRPEAMKRMGDKVEARRTMIEAGVPVTPGSEGVIETVEEAKAFANQIKYPVIIKASAGGGGRGMRIAYNDEELVSGFHAAKHEATTAFGNGDVYIEKFIVNPRHIEFQILADEYGNVVHLGERDCSLQRRNQKLIEEAPSAALSEELRQKMGQAAVTAAKAAGYSNAGTIEFLLSDNDEFYFMEMNTRIQVEHPVTEMVTGIDLIKEQIRVAAGERLSFTQDDIILRGHAIEVRINAENTQRNFAPTPGKIEQFIAPGGLGVRMDTHIYTGYNIPPNYDSMIGKLIIHAPTRLEAIARAKRALHELIIRGPGISTTSDFAIHLLEQPEVVSGHFNTGFILDLLDREAKEKE